MRPHVVPRTASFGRTVIAVTFASQGNGPPGHAREPGWIHPAGRLQRVTEEQPRVFGAYLLLQALGRGAMGDVWLARPLNPDRGIPSPVVVKRLHGELAMKKAFVARFRHEAAVAVCVDSPHVAKVYDVGAVGEALYIAMEYVPGWPLTKVLDAILRSGRHASIASVLDLIAGGLEGLHALHTATDAQGAKLEIVHRDISPKNLMVGEDGRMRLIDLGLGRSNAQDWKTRTGVVMGSVGYMPPEQARGERVDARADVYSMAVVCFEMLVLRNYVKPGSMEAMVATAMHPVFTEPSKLRPDVPPALDQILSRALAPDREHRYGSARELLEALRTIVASAHVEGEMSELIEELFGATRRERREEIGRLLALPLPVEPSDAEPTRVFVTRAGVLPPDLQPTEYVRSDAISVPEPRVTPVRRSLDRPAENEPSSTLPPLDGARVRVGPRRVGLSIPVLVVMVLTAAVLGGVGALWLAGTFGVAAESPPPKVVGRPPPAPPRPVLVPQPSVEPEPPEPPPPPVKTELVRTRPKRRPPSKRVAPPPRPRRRPPPASVDLDAELERLKAKATARRNSVEDPARRAQLNRFLSEVGAWLKSSNQEKKRAALRDLKGRLDTL